MSGDDENMKRFACVVGGVALGALLLKSHYDEAKKSRAEKDDPEEVECICNLIGDLLEDWTPRGYDTEDECSEALSRYLNRAVPEALDEDDPEVEFELWPDTSEGKPDLLIDDCLALELKVNLLGFSLLAPDHQSQNAQLFMGNHRRQTWEYIINPFVAAPLFTPFEELT